MEEAARLKEDVLEKWGWILADDPRSLIAIGNLASMH